MDVQVVIKTERKVERIRKAHGKNASFLGVRDCKMGHNTWKKKLSEKWFKVKHNHMKIIVVDNENLTRAELGPATSGIVIYLFI